MIQSLRWVYRIDSQDDRMMSWGTQHAGMPGVILSDMPEPYKTLYVGFMTGLVAIQAVQDTRAGHSWYTDFLMVWVWPEREHEHYEKKIPDDAKLYIYSYTGLVAIVNGTEEYKQWKSQYQSFCSSDSSGDGSSSSPAESSPTGE